MKIVARSSRWLVTTSYWPLGLYCAICATFSVAVELDGTRDLVGCGVDYKNLRRHRINQNHCLAIRRHSDTAQPIGDQYLLHPLSCTKNDHGGERIFFVLGVELAAIRQHLYAMRLVGAYRDDVVMLTCLGIYLENDAAILADGVKLSPGPHLTPCGAK